MRALRTDCVRTVQATIEDALSLVLRTPITLTVAGRTDAGVHATGQVAHADIPRFARLGIPTLLFGPGSIDRGERFGHHDPVRSIPSGDS